MIPLEKYTAAYQFLAAFKEKHKDILNDLAEYEKALADLEAEVKAEARALGPHENSFFKVLVQPKYRQWYDTDIILQACPFVKEMPGVLVQSIDVKRIEALYKAKAIPEDVMASALRSEALTPAVSIKPK